MMDLTLNDADVHLVLLGPPVEEESVKNAEYGQTFIDVAELLEHYLLYEGFNWKRLICEHDNMGEINTQFIPKLMPQLESGEIIDTL